MHLKIASLIAPQPSTFRGQKTQISVKNSKLLYCNNKTVVLLCLDTQVSACFTKHVHQTTVARFSPCGRWVASGDASGIIRIWLADGLGEKYEYRALGGAVKDISWEPEGRHLLAVGEGKEKFAHAFHMDSGSSVGEIAGPFRTANACAIRPIRPLYAVLGSDDHSMYVYSGVPYRFVRSIKQHRNFVQAISYTPDGKFYASGGSDGKIFVFDAETNQIIFDMEEKSSVDTVLWIDNSRLLTSTINSAKIWSQGECTKDIKTDHIVGLAYEDGRIITVSLDGAIRIYDLDGLEIKALQGHQKGITSLFKGKSENILYSLDYDGHLCSYEDGRLSSLTRSDLLINAHFAANNVLYTEDRLLDKNLTTLGQYPEIASVYIDEKATIVLGKRCLNIKEKIPLKFEASCLAVHGNTVAVGSCAEKIVAIFINQNYSTALEELIGNPTALAFSEDGLCLAVGDAERRIKVYSCLDWKPLKCTWCFHAAKITHLVWTSKYLVSCALDNSIMLWSIDSSFKPVQVIKNAHSGPITSLIVFDDKKFVTAGQDATIKIWQIV